MNYKNQKNSVIITTKDFKILYDYEKRDYITIKADKNELTLFIPSCCDTTDGYDKNIAFTSFEIRDCGSFYELQWKYMSNLWEKEFFLRIYENRIEYSYVLYGKGKIDVLHYFEGIEESSFAQHIDFSKHINDKRKTEYKEYRQGSPSTFSLVCNPEPNAYAKQEFSFYEYTQISANSDLDYCGGNYNFNPGVLCYGVTTDKEEYLSLGLAIPKGEYYFTEYEYNGGMQYGLTLNYWGLHEIDGSFESPAIVIVKGNTYLEMLENYIRVLETGGFINKNIHKQYSWWKEPKVCGWGEQCYIGDLFRLRSPAERGADTRVYDSCCQNNYEYFINILEQEKVPWRTIIIDNKWASCGGKKEVDVGKWYNLRGFVDRLHDMGKKVILWFGMWECDGLDAEMCITFEEDGFKAQENRDGRFKKFGGLKDKQKVAPDPSIKEYRDFLEEKIRFLLSSEEGCCNCDGFKFDYVSATPGLYGLKYSERSEKVYGIEGLKYLQTFIYNKAKEVKEDALIIGQSCNPYFIDCTDMIRIGDIYSPYTKVYNLIDYRVNICKAVSKEWLIDIDSWPIPSLEEYLKVIDYQTKKGTVSLYYITHIDTTGEKICKEDYIKINRILSVEEKR